MKVVNVRAFGGAAKAKRAGVRIVMRGWSPLGNPFVLGKDGTREEVIEKYRRWLWERVLAGDEVILQELRSLRKGDRIGCCCKPLDCHADVVVTVAKWLQLRDAKARHGRRSSKRYST